MILFTLCLGIAFERVGRSLVHVGNALILWSAKRRSHAD